MERENPGCSVRGTLGGTWVLSLTSHLMLQASLTWA